MPRIFVGLALVLSLASVHSAQGSWSYRNPAIIVTMDACGDSITTGFNAQSSFPCPNTDQEQYNWATSDTHGSALCAPGPDGVFSHAERIECTKGANIVAASPNSAESGASMLDRFVGQANNVHARLTAQPGPRYVPVLMGQNDVCAGQVWKFQRSCPRGSDQDPNNYCRTTPGAFERELRRGLDVLMSIPDTHVGVASLARVSQLCNHAGKQNCQTFTSCGDLWRQAARGRFARDGGICGSLTASCTNSRIADAYRTAKIYRDILMRVTNEYAAIPPGEMSPIVTVGGQTVGGGFKAEGVTVAYSDAPWRYRFSGSELSCCDCLHPSAAGQNALSDHLFNGLRCTPERPCCADTGNAVADGKCAMPITDGRFIPGLFPPAGTN